jgi:amylosucrase
MSLESVPAFAEGGFDNLTTPASSDEPAIWRRLLARLESVYGSDALACGLNERVRGVIAAARAARPAPLQALDRQRQADPDWISRSGQSVYTFYVDRFADSLRGVLSG